MRVWLARAAAAAWPAPAGTLASQAKISSSTGARRGGGLEALNDQILPMNSSDREVPRFTWSAMSDGPTGAGELEGGTRNQGRSGGVQWVQYDFPATVSLSVSSVYWVAGGGTRLRLPANYRLLAKQGDAWVSIVENLALAADKLNEVDFAPVTTKGIRLEATLVRGAGAGLLEWSVK